ncbi:general secretion pathway protein GspD [Pirellulaceae bacterium]|nr:general secretion pathway protein GspD [Pirellulaceae bacterium]
MNIPITYLFARPNRQRLLSRVFLAITVVALVGATNVIAQSDTENAASQQYSRYTVFNNPPQDIAPRLKIVLKDFGFDVEIFIDEANNTLAVQGDPQVHQMVGQLLKTLDKKPINESATPTPAAPSVIQGYSVPAESIAALVTKLRAKFVQTNNVRVAPDTRTNQVIVIATVDQQKIASELISQSNAVSSKSPIPAQNVSAPVTPSGHLLRNMTTRQFEVALRNILGGKLTLTTDASGRLATVRLPGPQGASAQMTIDRDRSTVKVTGDKNTTTSWLRVAAALDKPVNDENTRTGIVPVKRADPTTVQDAIALVRGAKTDGSDAQAAVQFVPSANRQKWGGDLVSSIFQDSDATQPDANQPGELGSTVLSVAPEEAGLIGPVQIEFIEGLGVFIIKGHRNDVQRVIEIIEQIEQHTDDTQPHVIVHELQHVNSTVLAELVEELYDDVFGTRNSPVSITSLDKPNALLLIGRQESMKAILDLIDKLDQPVPPSTQLKFFQLKHMSALDAERQIRDFYTNQPGADDGIRPGLGVRPRVIADYRTNSLVVNASPRDLVEIAMLIDRLDVEESPATNQLRVFRLKNALAADLQPVLEEAITGISATQQQGGQGQTGSTATISPQSSKLEILTITTNGESKINSGILAGATITADENVNALVVRAPATAMPLIEELIGQLDQLPNAEAQIKVFQVENGDAINLAQLLQELFGLQVTAGNNASSNAFNNALSAGGGGIGGGESSLVPLRFAVDQRTNSVIASGSSTDLEIVELLLIRLDEGDIQTRRTEVIRLENADATTVGTTLTNYVNTQRQLLTQNVNQQSSITNAEIKETQVVIGFDALSNSLILSAPPRNFETLKQIITDLDFKPNMVMIQVVIAEVELNDGFEFGVELGLQDSMLFDRGAAVGYAFQGQPLGNDATPASLASRDTLLSQGIAGFGLGRSSATLGYGGFVFSAANESINILLRTLQDRGRLQILSRPQIMTLDMTDAFVQVGSNVARITGSTTNQFGGVSNSTEDVPIGLLLNVRPRVTPDGRIVMNLSTEKSELGPTDSGTPVAVTPDGQAILSPAINTTTASTVISAHDGETVVFAGLITKNKVVNRRSVPYLGDLPVLGQLFRYDTESEKRTELLIIMTPRVVNDESDIDEIKAVESDRMSWLLDDIIEVQGDVGLSKGKGLWGNGAKVIYPDDNPAGTLLDHAFPEPSVGAALGVDSYYQPATPPAPVTRSTIAPPAYVPPGFQSGMSDQREYKSQSTERTAQPLYSHTTPIPQQQQQVLPIYPANQYSHGAISAINATRTAPQPVQTRPNQPMQYPRTAYPQSSPDPRFDR